MNIFVTNQDPQQCAFALDDKRVVKMVLESAQMLCTALDMRGFGFPDMYRPTHMGHPCTVWTAETRKNFEWLGLHAFCLSEEYSCRYGKVHASHSTIEHCLALKEGIPEGPLTPFANCTDYKDEEVIKAYRKQMLDKWMSDVRSPTWSHRAPPFWATPHLHTHRSPEGVYYVAKR